jgi:hypothetical protein
MKITLAFRRSWDEAAWKTELLHPTGAPAFLLTWEPDPSPVDGGIPEPLVPSLVRALGTLGPLVFCLLWPPEPPAPSLQLLPQPTRSAMRTILDALNHRFPPAIALSTDAAGAAVFLDQGWSDEAQLGFLLSPGTIPDATLLTLLFHGSAWHDFRFPSPVQALIAPANDGDGVFVAATTDSIITRIVARFTEHLTGAGFSVENP